MIKREPDWETLSEINFLLNNRLTDQLGVALSALEKLPEADNQRARAQTAVRSVLNMHTAWANLIRQKTGADVALSGDSRFEMRAMLAWIAPVLQIAEWPHLDKDIMLAGDQATIQEALLLLHSCAQTLGPSVRVIVEAHPHGFWFRVRYGTTNHAPATLHELLASLQANWREQSAGFELRSAQDFLALNNSELFYATGEVACELTFFVRVVGPATGQGRASTQKQARTLLDSYNADETHRVITD